MIMQVFEFHFNPDSLSEKTKIRAAAGLFFDSFCYEPENIYEKQLGNLYIVGLLENALYSKSKFLDNLSKLFKEKYYGSARLTQEKALKKSLKKANEFLETIAKKGDAGWLGNINFAVLSLKKSYLTFSKVGEIKILLLRQGQIIDIDKEIKLKDIEPYPLKIFGNVVSTKLSDNDLILVLTKDVFEVFNKENLISEIAEISSFEEKKLKNVLEKKNDLITKISGICLAIALTKKEGPPQKKEVFSPALKFSPKINLNLPRLDLKLPKINLKLPKLKLSKNIITVAALILLLCFSFFIFQKEEAKDSQDNEILQYEPELVLEGENKILERDKKFDFAVAELEKIFFFSKPNQLTILEQGNLSNLTLKNLNFNFTCFAPFEGNLYFFDQNSSEIIKYPFPINVNKDWPKIWFSKETKKPLAVKSMAIDGSIWLLEDNQIKRYYAGKYMETLKLEISPEIKNLEKIFTSETLPYLYILEPVQKRVLIINKKGEIFKQFSSEKFDNLLDFTVSADGKTIYLLNGLNVYKASL